MSCTLVRYLGLVLLLLHLAALPTTGQEKSSERWEKEIAAIEKRLKETPPPPDSIFFAGSSSIVKWNLAKSFPDLPVVKVGFGGSQLADSTHFAPRLLLRYAPRSIVLYAGDNDLAAGKTPETVHADFKAFVSAVQEKLPRTKILYLSIKPSLLRWKLIDKIRKTNALIEAECKKSDRLVFVDVGTPLLGEDGQPRKELFAKDGLHLSPEGYQVWTRVLTPLLK
jgi:lysophospholipase L1-like esterase